MDGHTARFSFALLWYIYQSSHEGTQPTRSCPCRSVPRETRAIAETRFLSHGVAASRLRTAGRTRISAISVRAQLPAALDRRRRPERNTPERHLCLRRQAVSLGTFFRL